MIVMSARNRVHGTATWSCTRVVIQTSYSSRADLVSIGVVQQDQEEAGPMSSSRSCRRQPAIFVKKTGSRITAPIMMEEASWLTRNHRTVGSWQFVDGWVGAVTSSWRVIVTEESQSAGIGAPDDRDVLPRVVVKLGRASAECRDGGLTSATSHDDDGTLTHRSNPARSRTRAVVQELLLTRCLSLRRPKPRQMHACHRRGCFAKAQMHHRSRSGRGRADPRS
jgi:hypothetical protein